MIFSKPKRRYGYCKDLQDNVITMIKKIFVSVDRKEISKRRKLFDFCGKDTCILITGALLREYRKDLFIH